MILLAIALGWLALVAALIFKIAGQLRAYERLHPAPPPLPDAAPAVSVIVPARNEARNIERCLAGLQSQTYPAHRLEIIVVDDNSTDSTSDLVRRITAADPRVRLIQAGRLPGGWKGKPHAIWQGVQIAGGDWLCFVDADTAAQPALISTAVRFAQGRDLDLLSLNPFQELGTFWERLLLSCGILGLSIVDDIRQINDPAHPKAAANGQFILAWRTTYEALGGHAAVRHEITEDVALAKRFKRANRRTYLADGSRLLCTRMHTTLREIWDGFSKNMVDLMGGVPRTLLGGLGVLLLAWIPLALPLVALRAWAKAPRRRTGIASVVASAGSAALVIAGQAQGAARLRVPAWYVPLAPFGLTLLAVMMFTSALRHRSNGSTWKGRTYLPESDEAARPTQPQLVWASNNTLAADFEAKTSRRHAARKGKDYPLADNTWSAFLKDRMAQKAAQDAPHSAQPSHKQA